MENRSFTLGEKLSVTTWLENLPGLFSMAHSLRGRWQSLKSWPRNDHPAHHPNNARHRCPGRLAPAAHDTCQSRLDALIDWRTKD
jgi:hypothetical protein